MQDLQQQSAMLQKEYEYEKELYRQQTREAGIPKRIQQGVCWFPVKLGADRYNSLNQLTVEVTRTETEETEHSFEYGCPVCFFRISADRQIRYFNFSAVISYVQDNKMVVVLPGPQVLPELVVTGELGVQLYFDDTSYKTMFAALREVAEAKGNRTARLREVLLGKAPALRRETGPVRFPWLNASQEKAVNQVLCAKEVAVVHGPPGTGKTTTINMMIHYFEDEGCDIFLAAPTGRAAKRMTEATGFEAKTIHRLLELNGGTSDEDRNASFERNDLNPLEADVIIIDEMSMVDIYLFQALLKAITPGTRLIMVGDRNQLPSVGPGQVLKDLMESGAFATVILNKIFRQAGESDIVVNAHLINEGKQISLNNKSKDFFFLERDNVNVIYKHMILLITEKLPRYVHAGTFDIQVLTPMRKGALGVEVLNKILQQYLNPPSPEKEEVGHGDGILRLGDKVMQIKNNYQLEWEIVSKYGIAIDSGQGVFNGDTGIIREINETAKTLVVEYDDMRRVTYSLSGLDEIELAYAITIHKSQGSEYPAVIMPLLTGPRMLFNRNLLYTGVTRAKNCVTILGSSSTVMQMIENANEQKRFTGLKDRICEMMETMQTES